MREPKIHQFDPVIYPRLLWVVYKPTRQLLKDTFVSSKERIPLELSDDCDKDYDAVTIDRIARSGDGKKGVLICLFQKIGVGSISHESDHAANSILRDMGVEPSFDNDEAHAYLVGWIADCVNKVVKNKMES